MGRGVALVAKTLFQGLDRRLGSLIRERGNHVHYLGTWTGTGETPYNLFSFPVKHNYWEKASLALIKESVEQLAFQAVPFETIVMVRPGCGNGGRGWSVVKPILEPLLDDRFLIVERNP
jgi:hypothetical protein